MSCILILFNLITAPFVLMWSAQNIRVNYEFTMTVLIVWVIYMGVSWVAVSRGER